MIHLSQQYLLLHRSFSPFADREPIPVTLEDIARKLYCTERNAKLVVRKMAEQGWIDWTPGRGRGNRSALAFLVDRERMLMDNARHMAQRGDVPEALELIRQYGEGTSAKERFGEWLSAYFGYKEERTERNAVEVLRFPVTQSFYSLDPIVTYSALDLHIINQLFDTLVCFDRHSGTFLPRLAHHWETDGTNRTWTFYLRKGVSFHHGRELTADDAAYTFERLRREDGTSRYRWMFDGIERIEAVNRRTLRIRLKTPNHLFLRFVSNPCASVVPRDVCEEKEERFGREPVGTGPFQLTVNQPNRCVLEAFPTYFFGRAHLDRVEIIVVPEDCETFLEPRWNQVVRHNETLAGLHQPNWRKKETLLSGSSLLTFNLNRDGPQRSLAFRHALHHLADRGRMVEELGGNRMYPARGFDPAPDPSKDDPAYDPELARELLRQSGYAGETFRLLSSDKHSPDAYWLQRRCREFGINIVVDVRPWLTLLDSDDLSRADGMLNQLVLDEDEVSRIENFRAEKSFIRLYMADSMKAKCDRTIAAVFGEPSEAKRKAMLDDLERFQNEERTLLFLLHKKLSTSLHPSVKGVQFNTLGWIDFRHIWFQHDAGPEAGEAAAAVDNPA
ncbi:ABC transporter substrate-binding protein [Paenibacillus flagellatus]|uniref:ABC transporter substrate-binding protein n=1 Tax=Paenibacillus flagellatus TaxID=2211139 RepID=A0A2V5K174_9BACL|nr:ABC transporter substrate-binding protein [Paenibacillus flagellatus]PYI52841.1 ABC transporter substrate-binding protein [Paenibacillus flagellatus]